ncbi:flavodoxin family protein [Paraburkholderia sp. RL17-373-BIF-A]|uniref:flavodoxin family protein n=1 Tax=Paraburkholderia sp. RL17-373-BIF-A TaxID=3031629 RepID=UPI0038B8D353
MAEKRILVVYYSRSGVTRTIALTLGQMLDADVEEILDRRDRAGPFGYLRSLVEAMNQRPADVVPARKDPSSYEFVIVGTPIWAGSLASPVRAYLIANKSGLRHVAFFCSLGGRGSESAFAQMRALVGSPPVAQCKITAREAKRGETSQLLEDFVSKVQRALAEQRGPEKSPC